MLLPVRETGSQKEEDTYTLRGNRKEGCHNEVDDRNLKTDAQNSEMNVTDFKHEVVEDHAFEQIQENRKTHSGENISDTVCIGENNQPSAMTPPTMNSDDQKDKVTSAVDSSNEHVNSEHIYSNDDENASKSVTPTANENDNEEDDENDNEISLETSADLSFKKKEVNRNRTQSFQSVLSTASLKSLKQQFTNGNTNTTINKPQLARNGSIVSNSGHVNNTKNFQSFIQAPVLSSISNLKTTDDDLEIGKQLPFKNDVEASQEKESEVLNDDVDEDYDDKDTILQQQRLTLNALKKLSLSPMPIIDLDNGSKSRAVSRKGSAAKLENSDKRMKNSEPYQPAEVDLSTFASLTRQPHVEKPEIHAPNGREISPKSVKNLETTTDTSNESLKSKIEHPIQLYSNHAKLARGVQPMPETFSIPRRNDSSDNMNKNFKAAERMRGQYTLSDAVDRNAGHTSSNVALKTIQMQNSQEDKSLHHRDLERYRALSLQSKYHQKVQSLQGQYHEHNLNASQKNPARVFMQPEPRRRLQQINGFRSPMYIPAVLRMTLNNGLNSGKSASESNLGSVPNSPIDSALDSPSPVDSQYFKTNTDPNIVTKSSKDSIKSVESTPSVDSARSTSPGRSSVYIGSFKLRNQDITRAPTKKHWLKDEAVYKCGIESCPKVFNFFERKHHCRKCGGIFCKEHTSHYLYINHLAQFTTGGRGTLSKVCDNCIHEYNEFMNHEFGLAKPEAAHQPVIESNKKKDSTDISNGHHVHQNSYSRKSDNRNEQVVGSVPANWSWSSF
ncbi:uncharacterized protein PRCAT00001367001 [Priceomyces carsonii]|uniref:uncharacterized protein n=1 Tax=Priceomyces carsonii TaxID=28549 RepID=UPI002EDA4B33|nr:unnamed protein product [Priceomyces carsonii]